MRLRFDFSRTPLDLQLFILEKTHSKDSLKLLRVNSNTRNLILLQGVFEKDVDQIVFHRQTIPEAIQRREQRESDEQLNELLDPIVSCLAFDLLIAFIKTHYFQFNWTLLLFSFLLYYFYPKMVAALSYDIFIALNLGEVLDLPPWIQWAIFLTLCWVSKKYQPKPIPIEPTDQVLVSIFPRGSKDGLDLSLWNLKEPISKTITKCRLIKNLASSYDFHLSGCPERRISNLFPGLRVVEDLEFGCLMALGYIWDQATSNQIQLTNRVKIDLFSLTALEMRFTCKHLKRVVVGTLNSGQSLHFTVPTHEIEAFWEALCTLPTKVIICEVSPKENWNFIDFLKEGPPNRSPEAKLCVFFRDFEEQKEIIADQLEVIKEFDEVVGFYLVDRLLMVFERHLPKQLPFDNRAENRKLLLRSKCFANDFADYRCLFVVGPFDFPFVFAETL